MTSAPVVVDSAGLSAQLGRLGEVLSPLQLRRVEALRALMSSDGRINYASALAAVFPRSDEATAQTSFRKFRLDLDSAILESGINLRLMVDSAKRTPPEDRRCWFEGDDPAIAQLEAMSAEEVRDPYSDEHIVASRAARVLSAHGLRVFVDAAEADLDSVQYQDFLARFTVTLELLSGAKVRVHTARSSALAGQRASEEIAKRQSEVDFTVRLISPRYLAEHSPDDEADLESMATLTRLDVLFRALPASFNYSGSTIDPQRIVTGLGGSFAKQRGEDKDAFVTEVANRAILLVRGLGTVAGSGSRADEIISTLSRQSLSFEAAGDETIAGARAAVFDLDTATGDSRSRRLLSKSFDVVERLIAWSTSSSFDSEPSHCALLGDYGTGKTTTARELTRKLLEKRRLDPSTPLPLYFDLRMLSAKSALECGRLVDVFESLMSQMENSELLPTGTELIDIVNTRATVIIFDGLDEVLVHLDPWEGQRFTRILWRAIRPSLEGDGGSKVLLTCRTHFFRSIQDEADHFIGQDRFGPSARNYLALVLLPFSDLQIRSYLSANVPGADVDGLMNLMAGVHNLSELAQRPYTLRLISGQLEAIETAKLDGRTIRPTDIYGNIVESWLGRDNGKHTLLRQHKKLLMEQLAAQLWRSGRAAWSADRLEQWFVEFFSFRSDIRAHYGSITQSIELLKEDLRTATFISRGNDDGFRFAHTSLQEYFLATHLARALLESAGLEIESRWRMPVPSAETLSFLGQTLTSLPAADLGRAMSALETLKRDSSGQSALLVFRYGVHAREHGYPAHNLAHSSLNDLGLDGMRAMGQVGEMLDLRSASLRSASLRASKFIRVDLRGADLSDADLSGSEFTECLLDESSLNGARLAGTAFRHSSMVNVDLEGAQPYRTQVVNSPGMQGLRLTQGWLPEVDSLDAADVVRPVGRGASVFIGHSGAIVSAAVSPDEKQIVTASSDHTAKLWDFVTGENLATLAGHGGPLTAASFSPNGKHIATTAVDGTVRIWSMETLGQDAVLPFSGEPREISHVPGAESIAILDDAGLTVRSTRTGEVLLDLNRRAGPVEHFAISRDGRLMLTANGSTSADMWDMHSGEHLHTLTDYQGPVLKVGFGAEDSVYTTNAYGRLSIWGIDGGHRRHVTLGQILFTVGINHSADGSIIFAATAQGGSIWTSDTGSRLFRVSAGEGHLTSGAFSPTDPLILSTTSYGVASLQDYAAGVTVASLNHGRPIEKGFFSPSGQFIVTVGDGVVSAWGVATQKRLVTIGREKHAFTSAASVHGPSFRILTTGGEAAAAIWDLRSGARMVELAPATRGDSKTAFSRSGDLVATAGSNGVVRISSASSGALLKTLEVGRGRVNALQFGPDESVIVCARDDRSAQVWRIDSADAIVSVSARLGTLSASELSPNSQHLLLAGAEGAQVCDATTGEYLFALRGHGGAVTSATYSPNGATILTTSTDHTAALWNATTGAHERTLIGHPTAVTYGCFSADGGRIATCGADGSIRLFSRDGAPLATEMRHDGPVTCAGFLDGPLEIVSLGSDNTIRRHHVGSDLEDELSIHLLPNGEFASLRSGGELPVEHSTDAWRWFGILAQFEGNLWRFPAPL